MQDEMYKDFLLGIRTLASRLNTLSENGSLALQEWKRAKKREFSLEEYQLAEDTIRKDCSTLEEIYGNLIFEVLRKIRQAEEFLSDEELDSLKKVVQHDIQQTFLSWDRYQSQKENG
jgi:hypothetical protein